MSTKYKFSDEVPSDVLVARLRELSDAITKGSKMIASEFYMSIPAQVDRDADLVLSGAAKRIEDLLKQLKQKDEEIERLNEEVVKFAGCLQAASIALRQIDQANDNPDKFNTIIDYIINSIAKVILEALDKDQQYNNIIKR